MAPPRDYHSLKHALSLIQQRLEDEEKRLDYKYEKIQDRIDKWLNESAREIEFGVELNQEHYRLERMIH